MTSSRLDQVADVSGVELVRLSKLCPLPSYVKIAEEATIRAPKHHPSAVLADPIRGQFPCDTKASTFVSALFFESKKAEYHPKDCAKVQERLDHLCEFWGIADDVSVMREQLHQKSASGETVLPDSAFAWVTVHPDGSKDRRLRIHTGEEICKVADYLEKWRDKFTFDQRATIASRTLKAAAMINAPLSGDVRHMLEKHAGRGCPNPQKVQAELETRCQLVKTAEAREKMAWLVVTCAGAPAIALNGENLPKLASLLEQFDKEHSLVSKYGSFLSKPEDFLFQATWSKSASELAESVSLTSGGVYDKAALSRMPLSDLEDLFGPEFTSRISNPFGLDTEKFAAEAAALPRPEAEQLEDALRGRGVTPLLKRASPRFSKQELEELASLAF